MQIEKKKKRKGRHFIFKNESIKNICDAVEITKHPQIPF